MSYYEAEASAVIPASPDRVYDILTDYHKAHPAILPAPYFEKIKVVSGGRGAGTTFDLTMNVFGVRRDFHMVVSEPEPDRLLKAAPRLPGTLAGASRQADNHGPVRSGPRAGRTGAEVPRMADLHDLLVPPAGDRAGGRALAVGAGTRGDPRALCLVRARGA